MTPEQMRRTLSKSEGDHKFSHGHAMVLSGGAGKGGAARLAARAALRIGAGVVTLGCPPTAQFENAIRLDAIMLRRIKTPDDLGEALTDPRLNALCLGPAFGTGPREVALTDVALNAKNRAVVLDADALTLVAQTPELPENLHQACVLTPHMGEFARLCPDLAEDLKQGKSVRDEVTRAAAQRLGCHILLKGAKTVVAAPDGAVAKINTTGPDAAPWLATAGAGDVLAGMITGLLARQVPPFEAARMAVWLHAECARSFGPGLIAEDLPEQLPRVFKSLGVC